MIFSALALMMSAPADAEARFELRDPDSGKVLQSLGLCTQTSVSAEVGEEEQTDIPIVSLTLDDRGKDWLARMTSAYIGYQLAVLIGDEPLVEAYIHEPILGGKVQVTGGFTAEKANETVMHLNSMCEQGQSE